MMDCEHLLDELARCFAHAAVDALFAEMERPESVSRRSGLESTNEGRSVSERQHPIRTDSTTATTPP